MKVVFILLAIGLFSAVIGYLWSRFLEKTIGPRE